MIKTDRAETIFIVLVCIFAGSISIASVLASKIITVAGLFVPAGILAYAITFTCTDAVAEIWGARRANTMVLGGFMALIVMLAMVKVSLIWPKAPFWSHDAAYATVLGSTARIIVASLVAYLVSQYHDVWAFHLLKRLTRDRHLWLRNNLSTAVSQFIDSLLFITIAFYGVMPVWPLIWGQWAVKMVIALCDTPVVYLLVWRIRKSGSSGPMPARGAVL